MKNYKINFLEHERSDVLRVLNESNDIIIDTLTDHSVSITIERDDADDFYQRLLQRIDHEVNPHLNTNLF